MVARRVLARGDVHLVNLDPTTGSEIRKTRRVGISHGANNLQGFRAGK